MRLYLFLFSFLFYSILNAQEETTTFPDSWVGTWQGSLEIFSPKGKEQQIAMELHIEKRSDSTDVATYTWYITYGEDQRRYLLKAVDPALGRYAIDEQNTIILDAILISGKLYSRFDVMGNMLLSTVELVDGVLHYEIISGKLDPLRVTGDTEFEGEEIPEVNSYPVVVRQMARLRRK
jgi:hypothetical protein